MSDLPERSRLLALPVPRPPAWGPDSSRGVPRGVVLGRKALRVGGGPCSDRKGRAAERSGEAVPCPSSLSVSAAHLALQQETDRQSPFQRRQVPGSIGCRERQVPGAGGMAKGPAAVNCPLWPVSAACPLVVNQVQAVPPQLSAAEMVLGPRCPRPTGMHHGAGRGGLGLTVS